MSIKHTVNDIQKGLELFFLIKGELLKVITASQGQCTRFIIPAYLVPCN